MTDKPLRIAVISDIHANLEAFRAVLGDIDDQNVDSIICLGDIIGYGPDPQECVDLIRERDIPTVMGNHEQGLINQIYLARFNPPTRDMILMTRELLDDETVNWLITRPKALIMHGSRFVHGCPPDLVGEYLWKHAGCYERLFYNYPEQFCFVGHTHELIHIHGDIDDVTNDLLEPGRISLDMDERHIINVGSVGQPRSNGPEAKYVIHDAAARTLEVRFIPYDNQTTADKIRTRGFNRAFADRLLR